MCLSAQGHLCSSSLACRPFLDHSVMRCVSTESRTPAVITGECVGVRGLCSTVRQTQTQILALPLTSHVVLGKRLGLTEPLCPHL